MSTLKVATIACAVLFVYAWLGPTLAVIADHVREHFRGKRLRRERNREKLKGIILQ